jgi:hypothetical protein
MLAASRPVTNVKDVVQLIVFVKINVKRARPVVMMVVVQGLAVTAPVAGRLIVRIV